MKDLFIFVEKTWYKILSKINATFEGQVNNKRDSTLEEHKGVKGFHHWQKSQTFIVIGWDPWIYENG